MSDININELAETINNKADRNLQNTSDNIDYVVERYQDGTTWYRLYKSGWVEQGGRGTSSGVGFTTITLPKEMANTNYTLLNCNNRPSAAGDQRDAYIMSTTQIGIGSDGCIPIWYVCGQAK